MQPLFLRFYDTWVARDSEGAMFSRAFGSEVTDAYGTHSMLQGLAFPVTCCWNGLAVFDAQALYQSGLKFRCVSTNRCIWHPLHAPRAGLSCCMLLEWAGCV